jgi:uncharacterized protein (TIGR00730 family)
MNVCVFCGSNLGDNRIHISAAEEFGLYLANAGFTLIYGGGKVGLMGILADSVLKNDGTVIGVIPDFLLKQEVAHRGLSELEIVTSMHERKKRMADLSDVFVALPGGWGTLDELAEILTWNQLRLINKPVFILNVEGFFDHLISQMEQMCASGFLSKDNLQSLIVVCTPRELMSHLMS